MKPAIIAAIVISTVLVVTGIALGLYFGLRTTSQTITPSTKGTLSLTESANKKHHADFFRPRDSIQLTYTGKDASKPKVFQYQVDSQPVVTISNTSDQTINTEMPDVYTDKLVFSVTVDNDIIYSETYKVTPFFTLSGPKDKVLVGTATQFQLDTIDEVAEHDIGFQVSTGTEFKDTTYFYNRVKKTISWTPTAVASTAIVRVFTTSLKASGFPDELSYTYAALQIVAAHPDTPTNSSASISDFVIKRHDGSIPTTWEYEESVDATWDSTGFTFTNAVLAWSPDNSTYTNFAGTISGRKNSWSFNLPTAAQLGSATVVYIRITDGSDATATATSAALTLKGLDWSFETKSVPTNFTSAVFSVLVNGDVVDAGFLEASNWAYTLTVTEGTSYTDANFSQVGTFSVNSRGVDKYELHFVITGSVDWFPQIGQVFMTPKVAYKPVSTTQRTYEQLTITQAASTAPDWTGFTLGEIKDGNFVPLEEGYVGGQTHEFAYQVTGSVSTPVIWQFSYVAKVGSTRRQVITDSRALTSPNVKQGTIHLQIPTFVQSNDVRLQVYSVAEPDNIQVSDVTFKVHQKFSLHQSVAESVAQHLTGAVQGEAILSNPLSNKLTLYLHGTTDDMSDFFGDYDIQYVMQYTITDSSQTIPDAAAYTDVTGTLKPFIHVSKVRFEFDQPNAMFNQFVHFRLKMVGNWQTGEDILTYPTIDGFYSNSTTAVGASTLEFVQLEDKEHQRKDQVVLGEHVFLGQPSNLTEQNVNFKDSYNLYLVRESGGTDTVVNGFLLTGMFFVDSRFNGVIDTSKFNERDVPDVSYSYRFALQDTSDSTLYFSTVFRFVPRYEIYVSGLTLPDKQQSDLFTLYVHFGKYSDFTNFNTKNHLDIDLNYEQYTGCVPILGNKCEQKRVTTKFEITQSTRPSGFLVGVTAADAKLRVLGISFLPACSTSINASCSEFSPFPPSTSSIFHVPQDTEVDILRKCIVSSSSIPLECKSDMNFGATSLLYKANDRPSLATTAQITAKSGQYFPLYRGSPNLVAF